MLVEAQVSHTPAILVCGPAGTGKSTFSRYLTNSLLSGKYASTGIAYLDIDPGQPEYSPPGEIALCHITEFNLGPPFTHPISSCTVRSHAIGTLTPRDDSNHYLHCVSNLLDHYQDLLHRQNGCPLIVNCCGWIQGMGLELLQEVAHCVSPTDIVYTSDVGPADVVALLHSICTQRKAQLHMLESQPANAIRRVPADSRLMQTMSYFHLDEPEIGEMRWNPAPIHTFDLTRLSYDGDDPDIMGICLYGEYLDPEVFDDVVDGSVLSLVVVEDDDILPRDYISTSYRAEASENVNGDAISDTSSHETIVSQKLSVQRTKCGLPYIFSRYSAYTALDPSKTRSIGQVLVRKIDTNSKELHVVTPVPKTAIDAYRFQGLKMVLVRGRVDIPSWAYQEEYYAAKAAQRRASVLSDCDKTVQDEDDGAVESGSTGFDLVAWAEAAPWVHLVEDNDSVRKRGKVLRVRRNLEMANRVPKKKP